MLASGRDKRKGKGKTSDKDMGEDKDKQPIVVVRLNLGGFRPVGGNNRDPLLPQLGYHPHMTCLVVHLQSLL